MMLNAGDIESELTNLAATRRERLESTIIPQWFDFPAFIEGLRLFYQRVEIGFWYTGKNTHTLRWQKLTSYLARKYALLEPLRITHIGDTSMIYDTSENRDAFRRIVAEEIISLFISCLDINCRKVEELRDLPLIIDKVLDCLYIFPSPLHRNPLLSFSCFVELNRRTSDTNSVTEVLKQSCRDCGIGVPDVLE